MKLIKAMVFGVAMLAMALSAESLFANRNGPFHDDPGGDGDGGGSGWNVTCTYDGNAVLISKVCNSGGTSTCNCP